MENALLTNLLLFLGALGISFALDGGSRDEDDRPDEADDPHARMGDSWAEEDIATDRDTLAWFLHGEEAVAPLGADALPGDETPDGSSDATGSEGGADHDDSSVPGNGSAEAGDTGYRGSYGLAFADETDSDGAEDATAPQDDHDSDHADDHDSDHADEDDARDPGEVEADVPEDGYADITGYTAGDRLELDYTPAFGADGQPLPPDFEVQHSEDGSLAALVLDGRTVAMVTGPDVAGLTSDHITLNPV